MGHRTIGWAALAAACLGWALLDAAGGQGQIAGRQPATATALTEIPANTWVDANPTYVLPDIKDARWVRTDGYCGSAYRSKTGTILFRSGVESAAAGLSPGFYSNATLAWDLVANEVRTVNVSPWGGGSYGGGRVPPDYKDHPAPSPRHVYDGFAYVESEDALYLVLGANWRIGSKAAEDVKGTLEEDGRSTWRYTFADGTWHRIPNGIRDLWPTDHEVSPYEAHLRHWPEGGKLLFLDDKGRHYAEFDLKAQTWEKVELKNQAPLSLYNARSTWDTQRGLWAFRLGPRACLFDPKTRQFQALPDSGLDAKDVSKGIAYIAKHQVYLTTGKTGNDTKVYEIAAGRWTDVKGGDTELVNGYLQYDARTDLVGLVYQGKAFAFRYVPRPATSAPAK
jgi:hypothetical protein